MEFAQLIGQVRSQLDDEGLSKVGSVLKEIEAGYNDTVDSLKAASSESKQRKIKIRELSSQVEDLEADITGLKKKSDTSELETELNDLKEFKAGVQKQNRGRFEAEFNKIKGHANFEKASGEFTLPDPDDEGNYDFTSMSDEDVDRNMNSLGRLNRLDYFANNSQGKDTKKTHGSRKESQPGDVLTQIQNAKTFEEVQQLQAEMN